MSERLCKCGHPPALHAGRFGCTATVSYRVESERTDGTCLCWFTPEYAATSAEAQAGGVQGEEGTR